MIMMKFLFFALLSFTLKFSFYVDSFNIPTNSSVCIQSDDDDFVFSYGSVTCTTGEVLLLGKYLKCGINNAGSFGTTSYYESDYYSGALSFIADIDKNGFSSPKQPSFSGDYFTPSTPIEGKILPKE